MPRQTFDLGFAAPDEAQAVADVIQEAARWVATWRAQLWDPELVGLAFVTPVIARGQMLTAKAVKVSKERGRDRRRDDPRTGGSALLA